MICQEKEDKKSLGQDMPGGKSNFPKCCQQQVRMLIMRMRRPKVISFCIASIREKIFFLIYRVGGGLSPME